jgi:hypothetical protein
VHVQAVLAVDARALDSGVGLELAFHLADWLAVGGDFPEIRDVVGRGALLALLVQKADASASDEALSLLGRRSTE